MLNDDELITISLTLPKDKLAGVYALLGGVSLSVVVSNVPKESAPVSQATSAPSVIGATLGRENPASAGIGETVQPTASPSDAALDADGHPWSADLHASTKAITGAGLWRMKPGASRPAPMPGFPKEETTGTASTGEASKAGNTAAGAIAEEDDEFAAFTKAAAASEAGDKVAASSVKARKWTDADLSKLCNQAAQKMGSATGPAEIKELIAEFVPTGAVVHSRNIEDELREEFAQALENKAGIEFAG